MFWVLFRAYCFGCLLISLVNKNRSLLFWSIFHVSIDPQNRRLKQHRLILLIVSKIETCSFHYNISSLDGFFSAFAWCSRLCCFFFLFRFIYNGRLIESTIRFQYGQDYDYKNKNEKIDWNDTVCWYHGCAPIDQSYVVTCEKFVSMRRRLTIKLIFVCT